MKNNAHYERRARHTNIVNVTSFEYKSCTHKQAYASQRAALIGLEQKAAYYDRPMRAYKCKLCKHWHLTTKV